MTTPNPKSRREVKAKCAECKRLKELIELLSVELGLIESAYRLLEQHYFEGKQPYRLISIRNALDSADRALTESNAQRGEE